MGCAGASVGGPEPMPAASEQRTQRRRCTRPERKITTPGAFFEGADSNCKETDGDGMGMGVTKCRGCVGCGAALGRLDRTWRELPQMLSLSNSRRGQSQCGSVGLG